MKRSRRDDDSSGAARVRLFVSSVPLHDQARATLRERCEALLDLRDEVDVSGPYGKPFLFVEVEALPAAYRLLHGLNGAELLPNTRPIAVEFARRRDQYRDKKDALFAFVPAALQAQLQVDEVALYSITDMATADHTTELVLALVGGRTDLVVTDANACVGGNTVSFARRFAAVHAIEMDAARHAMLAHNVRVMGLQGSVRTHRGDCITVIGEVITGRQDVLFFDPPWGGPDYKDAAAVPLFLSGAPLGDVIHSLRVKTGAQTVVVKGPLNTDMSCLSAALEHEDCAAVLVRAKKMLLVCMDFSPQVSAHALLERTASLPATVKRAFSSIVEAPRPQPAQQTNRRHFHPVVPPTAAGRGRAWVLLVMKGDRYVPGAVVAAYSLRRVGTTADIVCMVTDDVSEEARRQLGVVCSSVVSVPVLRFRCKRLKTAKQEGKYQEWSEEAFTKWNCLALTHYDKVMFFDADKVALRNMDHLFDLRAPAGTFSNPWAPPFEGGEAKDGKRAMVNPYVGIQHGELVPLDRMRRGFYEHSFVAPGTMVLLEPDAGMYKFLQALVKGREPFGFPECNSMMDEQSIARAYYEKSVQWTHIHQRYNFIPWKRAWVDAGDVPHVFHFFGEKPWEVDRLKWRDCESWWNLATALLADEAFTDEQRALVRACFDAKNLAQMPPPQCFWCETSGSHNVFDASGALVCPGLLQQQQQ